MDSNTLYNFSSNWGGLQLTGQIFAWKICRSKTEASLADAQHAKDGDAGGDHSLKFLSVGGAMLVWP